MFYSTSTLANWEREEVGKGRSERASDVFTTKRQSTSKHHAHIRSSEDAYAYACLRAGMFTYTLGETFGRKGKGVDMMRISKYRTQ